MASRKRLPLGTFLIFSIWVLILVVALSFWNSSTAYKQPPKELMGVLRPEPKPLSLFNLVDYKKEPFTRENLLGKWTFLFFGYTYCPDVCPMTLSVLTEFYKKLDDGVSDSSNVQVLFVSVDPDRDTPEKLADYMSFFNKKFIAVTGNKAEIDNFVQQYGAGYILEPETSPGEYVVNHTSAIFLVDPEGRLIALFSQPHNAETILAQYKKIRAFMR